MITGIIVPKNYYLCAPLMKPYKFEPYLKTTIWGGDQIASFKGITTSLRHVGESWEISGVEGHDSVTVDRGLPLDADVGMPLSRLIWKYRGLLVGNRVYDRYGTRFPLLVKFIDSWQDLSLQVHPGDALAYRRHRCAGKSEMWYIIRSNPGSKVYVGLKEKITPEQYMSLATAPAVDGRSPLMDAVVTHEAHNGDVFYLPAGRVHAIGAGCFLAEIQQTSDITYRIYDYDRVDAEGNRRQLHVKEAQEAIDYEVYPDYRLSYDTEKPSTQLIDCPYFNVQRIVVQKSAQVDLHTDAFVIVMCIWGEANVNGVSVRRGETLLVPACENVLNVFGDATFLTATM